MKRVLQYCSDTHWEWVSDSEGFACISHREYINLRAKILNIHHTSLRPIYSTDQTFDDLVIILDKITLEKGQKMEYMTIEVSIAYAKNTKNHIVEEKWHCCADEIDDEILELLHIMRTW